MFLRCSLPAFKMPQEIWYDVFMKSADSLKKNTHRNIFQRIIRALLLYWQPTDSFHAAFTTQLLNSQQCVFALVWSNSTSSFSNPAHHNLHDNKWIETRLWTLRREQPPAGISPGFCSCALCDSAEQAPAVAFTCSLPAEPREKNKLITQNAATPIFDSAWHRSDV